MTSPIVPLLPETAPFSEDQRSWLNGFFAGLLGADIGAAAATSMAPTTDAPAADVEEDDEDDGTVWPVKTWQPPLPRRLGEQAHALGAPGILNAVALPFAIQHVNLHRR